MKTTFKNLWIIQHPCGEIMPLSLKFGKKNCIDNWMQKTMTWEEAKKLGWKCLKVNVNFEIL